MNTRTRIAGVAAAALAVTGLGLTAPAHAEDVRLGDPADATASLTDIRSVKVNHAASRVHVKVRFTDLRRVSEAGPAGISIFFDTFGGDAGRGPEFRIGSGLQEGTDYALVETSGWSGPTSDPLSCSTRLELDYRRDLLRASTARRCLDSPDRLRVAVKMSDHFDGSHPVTDWLKGPRRWTRWLDAA